MRDGDVNHYTTSDVVEERQPLVILAAKTHQNERFCSIYPENKSSKVK